MDRGGGIPPLKILFNRGGDQGGDGEFLKFLGGDTAYRGGSPPVPPPVGRTLNGILRPYTVLFRKQEKLVNYKLFYEQFLNQL